MSINHRAALFLDVALQTALIPPPDYTPGAVHVTADEWARVRCWCGARLWWRIYNGTGERPQFWDPRAGAMVNRCPDCGQALAWPTSEAQRQGWQ